MTAMRLFSNRRLRPDPVIRMVRGSATSTVVAMRWSRRLARLCGLRFLRGIRVLPTQNPRLTFTIALSPGPQTLRSGVGFPILRRAGASSRRRRVDPEPLQVGLGLQHGPLIEFPAEVLPGRSDATKILSSDACA